MKHYLTQLKILLGILLVTITVDSYSQYFEFGWAGRIGAPLIDVAKLVAVDENGYLYCAGMFGGTVDFDIGPGSFNMSTYQNYQQFYLCKYDPSGSLIWAKSFGPISIVVAPYALEIGQDGEVVVAGTFFGTVDFDMGDGVNLLSASFGLDVFVLKLDGDGNFLWAQNMGGDSSDIIQTIAIDHLGNVIVFATMTGDCYISGTPQDFNFTTNSNFDVVIVKYQFSGEFLWARSVGGSDFDQANDSEVDTDNNIYVIGTYRYGVPDFDPGVDEYLLPEAVDYNGYVLKLDPEGNFVWANGYDAYTDGIGSPKCFGISISINSNNRLILGGYYSGTVDFDAGAGLMEFTSNNFNLFVMSLNLSGELLWVKELGSTSSVEGQFMALGANDDIYLANKCSGVVDFDPGPDTYELDTQGTNRFFVLQLDPMGEFIEVATTVAVGSSFVYGMAISDDNDVYVCGSFSSTMDFDPNEGVFNMVPFAQGDGFIFKWTQICYPSASELLSLSSCDEININNETYTSSGAYDQLLVNAVGCDSLLTLDITIHPSQQYSFSETSCDDYVFNGITYTESGNYVQTYTNQFGCDSIYTLDLEITAINATATLNQATLTANTNNATYQWIKCNPFEIISGATSQSYTATSNGLYAVIINQNGCADTSGCVAVNSIGIENLSLTKNFIHIYPNPNEGDFWIESNDQANYKLYTSNGLLLQKGIIRKGNNRMECGELPSGLYFMEFVVADRLERYKIMIR